MLEIQLAAAFFFFFFNGVSLCFSKAETPTVIKITVLSGHGREAPPDSFATFYVWDGWAAKPCRTMWRAVLNLLLLSRRSGVS